jgi:DUF917 family protein
MTAFIEAATNGLTVIDADYSARLNPEVLKLIRTES